MKISVCFYYLVAVFYCVHAHQLISLPFQKVKVKNANNNTSSKRSYYGATSIYNDNQIQYLVNVEIGTPPQNFIVIVDTGSPYFWIPGSNCPKSECPHPTFNATKSYTFNEYDHDFNINYNQGYARGFRGTDNVTLAGVTIKDQLMGVVVETEDAIQTGVDYDGTSADGILGLSYPHQDTLDSTGYITSIPFHMAMNGILAKPVFSIYTNSLYEEGWSGNIVLGGYNTSQFKDNHTIHYIPVQKDARYQEYTLWQMMIESVQVHDEKLNRTISHGVDDGVAYMSVDTGTTFTYVYEDYVRSILGSMNLLDDDNFDDRSGCYFIDCDYGKHDSHYQVQFKFKNNNTTTQLNIPLKELVEPVDFIDINAATKCFFSICASDDNYNFIMGDSVLRTMYSVFDMQNNRIGFAPTLYTNSTITTY